MNLLQLYYLRLPKDIKDYKVVLMDATVATGAAAMMAIRVLLDHEVLEENILVVSLLMAESGNYKIILYLVYTNVSLVPFISQCGFLSALQVFTL